MYMYTNRVEQLQVQVLLQLTGYSEPIEPTCYHSLHCLKKFIKINNAQKTIYLIILFFANKEMKRRVNCTSCTCNSNCNSKTKVVTHNLLTCLVKVLVLLSYVLNMYKIREYIKYILPRKIKKCQKKVK